MIIIKSTVMEIRTELLLIVSTRPIGLDNPDLLAAGNDCRTAGPSIYTR